MNRVQFTRRIIYLVIIVALLAPLTYLSMPSRRDAQGNQVSAGGVLAQMREENGLSQANLGEIDPAGEAIKLATLGMRGVATNVLWSKAQEQQKKEDFTGLTATLEQITKLQPNFLEVWRHQAWNLSYNISAQFDDYRDRYYWVIRGIDFLKDGARYNVDSPKLLEAVGWTISQKIGRADEKKQFRRLFVDDVDFHGDRPVRDRDNWLVGRDWYLLAEQAAEKRGTTGGASPLVFYSHAPLARINYAEALEDDGVFGERAQEAWELAERDWVDFGGRETMSSTGDVIRLGDSETLRPQVEELQSKLAALAPDAEAEIEADKRAELPEDQRVALDTPADERTDNQYMAAIQAETALQVTPEEIAERAPEADRAEARELAAEITKKEEQIRRLGSLRQIVNFKHWLVRCQMESEPEALEARRLISEADDAFQVENDLQAAPEMYAQGFAEWRKALDRFPAVLENGAFVSELMEPIERYQDLLRRRDETFPEDFVLIDVMRLSDPSASR